MRAQVKAFSAPKAGNAPSEYEDAYWVPENTSDAHEIRLAVADGATETSFAALWARHLVRVHGRGGLTAAQSPARVAKRPLVWERMMRSKKLPWYAEEKMRMGAFAAFAGLTLVADRAGGDVGTWRCLAIGDSCLVHLRDGNSLTRFPISDYQDFGARPRLLGTNGDDVKLLETTGTWQSGDTFLLMTDALAAWFYHLWDRRADPLGHLLITTQDEFEQLIDRQRQDFFEGSPLLKNDDVTLVICEVR